MKLEFESNTVVQPFVAADYAVDSEQFDRAEKVPQMLEAAIKAAQGGNRNEARQLLVQVTDVEPENETAWLWMASISEYPEELIIFLNNVLSINPNNARAVEWMRATKSLLANTFIERGSEALEGAHVEFARQCFSQAIVHDSRNETAWQSLADIAETVDEKVSHLQKINSLNPDNQTVRDSLEQLRKQALDQTLQKANRAAISGERETARTMLDEVLQSAPELEEAWILKAYLADSFSEKITAFEKVLTLNPENEMATAGLAALRVTMAKTEARRAEQTALIADFDRKMALEKETATASATSADQIADDGADAALTALTDRPTEKLEYPAGFAASEFYTENLAETETNRTGEAVEFSDGSTTDEEHPPTKMPAKSAVETIACPYCQAANEAGAVFCQACRTILSLSDLEMFFAEREIDTELLRRWVERTETERNARPMSSGELKNLAIGQLNLQNFRHGANALQIAAQMNPNDIELGAQVDRLQIRLAEIERRESAEERMQATSGRKVLVVDDSATIRKLISGKIEMGGHTAICAVDGIEALEKIKEFVPDLVLLDIMMPRLDGYQVCKFIRSNEATKNVPIIMISGKDGFFDKVRGRMAGTTGYITKPFGPETLMKIVESYLPPPPREAV